MTLTLPDLPPHLTLTHLILLDPEWQANIRAEEENSVAVGTGNTIAEAVERAIANAKDGKFVGHFTFPERLKATKANISNLLEVIGIGAEIKKGRRL